MPDPKIIFEDKSLLILDKPAGWIVNEAITTKNTPVVQTWLKKGFKYNIVRSKRFRSGIVHRLDKETSGCLVVAKTEGVFEGLQKQFKDRLVQKIYLALVHGDLELERGTVEVPVGRLPWNRERFGVLPGGKASKTSYRVKKRYRKDGEHYSLVELKPKTGRTHQIRIHLKYLGHPIVSDTFYAGRKTSKKDQTWCPRLFLHASEISFVHLKTKKKVSFKSDLPKDLKRALDKLEN